jgi:hypothetical protein
LKRILAFAISVLLIILSSPPALAADAYTNKWGTFKTQTFSGTGDDVIQLPVAVKAGYLTASHSGEANFAIWSLDASLQTELPSSVLDSQVRRPRDLK